MGKKKRIFINPRKFGKKHFEVLDNLDGTDDNIISSTTVSTTLRTLNLVDNGDRTVKLNAELFGSGSKINTLKYIFQVTGGVNLASPVTGDESISIGSAATSTGWPFDSSKPALQDDSGNVFVLPQGKVTIKAIVCDSADLPGALTGVESQSATLIESTTVSAAPIGITSALLSSSLSETGALTLDTTAGLVGTGPQHGSGSGVGSSQVYAITASVGHGFNLTAVGSVTGSLTLSHHGGTATTANGHESDSVTILSSASVAALAEQTLTVTLTPLDVNGNLSTSDAVSTEINVPFA